MFKHKERKCLVLFAPDDFLIVLECLGKLMINIHKTVNTSDADEYVVESIPRSIRM